MVGTCYFDSKNKAIKKPETKPKSEHQLFEGIYLIDKNWDPKQKDSILRKDSLIKLVNASKPLLLFITIQKDSMSIDIDQVNSKNPLILFNGSNSPYLCSLGDYKRAKRLIFQEMEITEDSKSISIEKPIDSYPREPSSLEEPIDERGPLNEPDFLNLRKQSSIANHQKRVALPSKIPLELSDRSLFYPILNNNQYLSIRFDNDFWDYTDYYYTNGIGIGYSHPVFAHSPLSYLLVSNGNSGIDYYGLQMAQHMYTGSQPKVDTIIPGDRPWAAYTLLGQFLKSLDTKNKLSHYSEINFGIVGPQSGGGFIQDLVHTLLPNNSPPEGWHNQIATDYIIDYKYQIQKLLWETKIFESYLSAGAQIGTLRDNIHWGLGGRLGKFIPFYQDISIYKKNRIAPTFERKLRFSIIADIQTQFIGYDATLQGGVTNKTSIYVIPSDDINRFVMEGFIGANVSYGRFNLDFIQYWKSKEFKTGKDHKYVSVRLNIAF